MSVSALLLIAIVTFVLLARAFRSLLLPDGGLMHIAALSPGGKPIIALPSQAMGGKVFYIGELGQASVIKVITNMLAFIHLVADGEDREDALDRAGGTRLFGKHLLDAGLLHDDILTVAGQSVLVQQAAHAATRGGVDVIHVQLHAQLVEVDVAALGDGGLEVDGAVAALLVALEPAAVPVGAAGAGDGELEDVVGRGEGDGDGELSVSTVRFRCSFIIKNPAATGLEN